MRNIILSPCGTSILTNIKRDKMSFIYAHANLKPEEITNQSNEVKIQCENIVAEAKRTIESMDINRACELSAELNSLVHFYKFKLTEHTSDVHYLIASDTYFGQETARFIKEWLDSQGFKSVEIISIEGLQTQDQNALNYAFSKLCSWLQEQVVPQKNNETKLIFNLTGGFKGVQGFMQTLGTYYGDEVIYIFFKELLRIPSLPIQLNALELVKSHFDEFRLISLGIKPDSISIPDFYYYTYAGEIDLSPWGKIIWAEYRDKLYKKELWKPPLSQIHLEESFKESVTGLTESENLELNKKLDDFLRFVHSGEKINLASLDCKRLSSNPCPPSTHEMDAFHNQGARRIFYHKKENHYYLDALGRHL